MKTSKAIELMAGELLTNPPKIPNEKRRWISAAEAARALGVSRERVYQLLRAGKIAGAQQTSDTGRWAIPSTLKRIRGKPGRPRKQLDD